MTRNTGTLLAVDSGHPDCAVAGALGGQLVFVGTMGLNGHASASTDYPDFWPADRVVVEVPTLRGDDTPNPESLILIAIRGVRVAEQVVSATGRVEEYRPNEWKGNTPKPPHHRRMWKALTPAERELLGGERTRLAIEAACRRGAKDRWAKKGATYYRARELPTVNGTKITHDLLDAAALALYALGRIGRG